MHFFGPLLPGAALSPTNVTLALSGIEASTVTGSLSAQIGCALACDNELLSQIGNLSALFTLTLSSDDIASSTGYLSVNTESALTGESLSAWIGSLSPSLSMQLSGENGVLSLGALAPTMPMQFIKWMVVEHQASLVVMASSPKQVIIESRPIQDIVTKIN